MQLSDFESSNNLVELFLRRADELGERPFLTAKQGGQWQSQSWREAAEDARLAYQAWCEADRGAARDARDAFVAAADREAIAAEWVSRLARGVDR